MLEDSKLVPSVINTLRFTKLITQLFRSDPTGRDENKGHGHGHTSASTSPSSSTVLSFHDFQRLLVGVSQGVSPVDPQATKSTPTPSAVAPVSSGTRGLTPLRDQKMVRLTEQIAPNFIEPLN